LPVEGVAAAGHDAAMEEVLCRILLDAEEAGEELGPHEALMADCELRQDD
jgi:hypothetical protein